MRVPGSAAGPAVVIAAGLAAGAWACGTVPDPDFLRLHAAGALVARGEAGLLYDRAPPPAGPVGRETGARPFRMPPAAGVACAPLGALPERAAWVLWVAACGAMAAGGCVLAAAAASRGGSPSGPLLLAAAIPAAPLALEAVARGNPAPTLLLLGAGSAFAFRRGADRAAGLLAGGAAALHLAPVLLPLWFAWKRRWRAAAWGLGAAAAFTALPPLAATGPAGGARLLGKWAAMGGVLVTEIDEVPGGSAGPAAVRVEGQAPAASLPRLLGGWRWFRLREMPLSPDASARDAMIDVGPARPLAPGTVSGIAFALVLAVLWTAMAATGPPAGPEAAPRDPALEAGLVLAAIPLAWVGARAGHFLLCAPALAALAAALPPRVRGPGAGAAGRAAAVLAAAGALLLFLSCDAVAGRGIAGPLLARGSAGWAGLLLVAASALTLFRPGGTVPGPAAGAAAGPTPRAP